MSKKPISRGKKAVLSKAPRSSAAKPLRFAHPFFTSTPPPDRPVDPAANTTSMALFAASQLGPIPTPKRNPIMQLQDIIGQPGTDEIQHAGAIRLHVIGDSGRAGGDITPQEQVTDAMKDDYDPAAAARNPALLIHL